MSDSELSTAPPPAREERQGGAAPGAADLLTSTVLQVASGAVLSLGPDGADQLRLVDGQSASLTAEEAAAIEVFGVPRTFESGVVALQRRFPRLDGGEALAIVVQLFETGLLRPHALEPARPSGRRNAGMYGCPATTLEEALAGDAAQVVFAGVPYELGVTGGRGTRSGPAYFRRCSRVSFDYAERQGVAAGWWDSGRQRRVLEGVRFCDIGDVRGGGGRNGEVFDRLYEVARSLFAAGRLPVTIGGDHSVSLPLITAAAAAHPGLGVLQFDAHADISTAADPGNWRKHCSHANFMSWVLANPKVASVTQFGLRHLLPEPPVDNPKVTRHPGRAFVADMEAIAAALPDGRPYYLTFDVDCLDPSVVSQTGTPVPGGLEYREVQRALELLASRLNIIGLDVVELAPAGADGDYREGTTIAYLVFEVLANVFARRNGARAA